MAKDIIRVVTSERLTRAAHWTVFGIGVIALGFSVAATAVSVL